MEGLELATISSANATDIGERLYIQVKDASSKFSASLDNIDASIDIGGVSSLSVTDGYVAFLVYFGLPTSTPPTPLRELSLTDSMASDPSRVGMLKLKPHSFARYANSLQVGSKKSSHQYSTRFKSMVYEKLIASFPDSQYDGVLIPGLPLGQDSIADLYTCTSTSCDDFPIRNFYQAIAVAYGYADTFDKATSFTLDQLFVPDFNAEAMGLLLDRLKRKNSLFNRFNSTEDGIPLDPSNKELFRLEKNFIQVALNLAVSSDLTASNFGSDDIL